MTTKNNWITLTLPKYFLGTRKPKSVLVYLPGPYEGWCIVVPSKLIRESEDSFTLTFTEMFEFVTELIEIDQNGNYVVSKKTSLDVSMIKALFEEALETKK